MPHPRIRPGPAWWLAMVVLLAVAGAAMLAGVTRRVTPAAQSGGPPLSPSSAKGFSAPSAEAEGHPVFEYPASSGVRPPGGVRPPASPRPSPAISAASRRSPSRPAARTVRRQPPAGPPAAPSEISGGRGRRQTGVGAGKARNTKGGPTQPPASSATAPSGSPPAGTEQGPSEGPTPATLDATPFPTASESSPTLRPPVPLEQPPLHPVLRATITSGPGGGSAVEEAAVRGRVKVRLLIRSDGGVASVEVILSSGDAALDEAARLGPLKWRFAPATRDGVPIAAYLLIWITFSV